MFRKLTQLIAGLVMVLASVSAHSALFHFTGNIRVHNDVIIVPFTLTADAVNVRVWTDSFQSAVNFDPITAVWNANSGILIGQNDDNPNIEPGQTYYDSGLTFASLLAGDYFFTIATFNNFAVSNQFSDGFAFDNQAPIPLSQWCQPANHCNMGTFWSVWLDGVDDATNPNIPEPGTLALLGLSLAGVAAMRRRG